MEWESDEYPQFCYGPIYIMTPQIAYQLFQLFKQTLKQYYIWIEDVYLTGTEYIPFLFSKLSISDIDSESESIISKSISMKNF